MVRIVFKHRAISTLGQRSQFRKFWYYLEGDSQGQAPRKSAFLTSCRHVSCLSSIMPRFFLGLRWIIQMINYDWEKQNYRLGGGTLNQTIITDLVYLTNIQQKLFVNSFNQQLTLLQTLAKHNWPSLYVPYKDKVTATQHSTRFCRFPICLHKTCSKHTPKCRCQTAIMGLICNWSD